MESLFGLNYVHVSMDNIDLAYNIQKQTWPEDPDYTDLYDKAINPLDDNCFWLIYLNSKLIGITGVDVFREYPDTIWLDWFTILPQYRNKGYGEKVLLDVINYCKKLENYKSFRIEATTYESIPALSLYDKVMITKENYTVEDTENIKLHTLIYTYPLYGQLELWNNKYLGLNKYYDNLKN